LQRRNRFNSIIASINPIPTKRVIIRQAQVQLTAIEAGHPARAEMESIMKNIFLAALAVLSLAAAIAPAANAQSTIDNNAIATRDQQTAPYSH
jgi:hypothetical protein